MLLTLYVYAKKIYKITLRSQHKKLEHQLNIGASDGHDHQMKLLTSDSAFVFVDITCSS